MQHEAFDSIYGTSSAEETLAVTPVEDEGLFAQDFLLVKVENSAVELEEGSRIDFSKPFTVSHDIKIRNIGRVVANSIWQLDNYFARGLGLTKP